MAPAGGSSQPPSGAVTYKKKDGVLAMSEDRESISWIPAAGGGKNGTVKIAVGSITSMCLSTCWEVGRFVACPGI